MISQSMPFIVMAMCWGRSSLDLVELVLDVDVFALAPCASVDCMFELVVNLVAERSWLLVFFLAFLFVIAA